MTDKIKGLLEHNESLNKQITQSIRESFVILLERKSFQEISITELCSKAGVSRMAFYSNYKTKEILFEEIVKELNKDIIEIVGSPFDRTIGLEWYVNFFSLMQMNADTVKTIFRADMSQYFEALNLVALNSRPLSDKQKYTRLVWIGGIVNSTMHWIDSDMNMSVENIATLCYKCLESTLSYYPEANRNNTNHGCGGE